MRLIAVTVQVGKYSFIIKSAKSGLRTSYLVNRRLESFSSASYHSMPIVDPLKKRARMSELTIGMLNIVGICMELGTLNLCKYPSD